MLPFQLNGLYDVQAEKTTRWIRKPLWKVSLKTCNFPVSPSYFNDLFSCQISGDKCISSAGLVGLCHWYASAVFGARHRSLKVEMCCWDSADGKVIGQHVIGAFKYWEIMAIIRWSKVFYGNMSNCILPKGLHNLFEGLTDTKHSSCTALTIHVLLADLPLSIKNI